MEKQLIYPDVNSWLSEALVDFFKSFRNEENLTLWDALKEYVGYHNGECAFLGKEYEGELELYPQVVYYPDTKVAVLDRLFFVSPEPETIIKHDYLSPKKEKIISRSNILSFFFSSKTQVKPIEEYPMLEFMVLHNSIEPASAKERLLKTSYERHHQKKLFVLKNEAEGIRYKSINITKIEFDLTFLEYCSFLNAVRYASFKQLLPPNLKLKIAVKMDFDIPDLPKHLIKHQMLDISILKE
ncbi:hypothetical protein A6V39_04360 [Candidatus Mycoplasma haematobovis]|uniref:Uncharacterized protein n=1 Tax=Candidatus Mycoplasma haematobovis TaxID=432608 RepID=A0A1A9QD21_9MOLU|nr:hypothetical protein [Candidatus Mycoplasma haematobovis]OAL10118.1 hypothetical protein A6V39_04360 [Candidatus Mycoplasma haematobovis]